MSEENVEIVRKGWEAWARGDLDGLFELWDPEIIFKTEHFHDWPESDYRGRDGFRQFLAEWLDVWGDYEVTVDEVLAASDGRVVSLFRQTGTGRQSGVPMELDMAQIATLREGKMIELDNYDSPAEALEAVGLPE
jgi:ketosteroid isomerase-like protein